MIRKLTTGVWHIRSFIDRKLNHIYVAWGSFIHPKTKIGRYTRINYPSHLDICEIGSFCAVGGRLVIRSSNHSTQYLNIQDYFQSIVLSSQVSVARHSKGPVKIGHSVWIGDSVIILSGVTIGNGAVIGAGSIVTKSIPDYAIAVGNPARVIKYRFSEEKIKLLNELAWWDWNIKKIKQNRFLFESNISEISVQELKSRIRSIV